MADLFLREINSAFLAAHSRLNWISSSRTDGPQRLMEKNHGSTRLVLPQRATPRLSHISHKLRQCSQAR